MAMFELPLIVATGSVSGDLNAHTILSAISKVLGTTIWLGGSKVGEYYDSVSFQQYLRVIELVNTYGAY